MSKVFITGDTHGSFYRFSVDNFPEGKELTKEDYVIICGDFGGIWYPEDSKYSKQEKYWLDWLSAKPWTTLFVDGNHENFDRLNAYPVEMWHGGKVHKITDSIIHLMRGQVFEINGKTFFTFGGASSHDIKDGILEPEEEEKIKEWNKNPFKLFRINHISWWKEELPLVEEVEEAVQNLWKYDWKVDYFISHCAATSVVLFFGYDSNDLDVLNVFFENWGLFYKKHYFGHYHRDLNFWGTENVLYGRIEEIM